MRQIAEEFGKSIGWVTTRIHKEKAPNTEDDTELRFIQKKVVPYLAGRGYKIMSRNQLNSEGFRMVADLVAVKNDKIYVVEVKNTVRAHSLQTAIGQVVCYKYMCREDGLGYIIVFPERYTEEPYLTDGFIEFMKETEGIEIVFV